MLQLPGRVYQKAIYFAGLELGLVSDVLSVDEPDSLGCDIAARIPATFKVPGHHDQKQIGKAFAQAQEDLSQHRLLALVSASTYQNARACWGTQLGQQTRYVEHSAFINCSRVKLQAAYHMNCFWPATQLTQSGRIRLVLTSHAAETREQRPEKESVAPVSMKGPLGKPRIH